MADEKFVGYFRLVEACGRSGCPVCRCVSNESRDHLGAILYEQVTDPDTRCTIRASWGFCNWHTWMLLDVENAVFGSAVIYEDLLRLALRSTEPLERTPRGKQRWKWLAAITGRSPRASLVDRYRGRAICPACRGAADVERRYLRTLATFAGDGDLQAAYTRSDGLCVPHLLAAAGPDGEGGGFTWLVEHTRKKWASVGQDIASFLSKHDYRHRGRFTDAEAASCARAFEVLAGARGIFGNDAHARTVVAPSEPRAPVAAPRLIPSP